MARDPPSLLASSELRDLPLQPSAIHNARVTIIHPQLRDLILPVERGRVLYPRGSVIEELKWSGGDSLDEEEEDDDMGSKARSGSSAARGASEAVAKPFVRLNFIPNCLTGSRGVLAAGGQHGELHLSSLPQGDGYHDSWKRTTRQAEGLAGEGASFSMSMMLPTRAINNSILVLPAYPDGWDRAASRRRKRMGFIGEGEERDDTDAARNEQDRREEEEAEAEEGYLRELETAEADDEAMDMDDDEGTMPPLSPATYPNTVPFRHPPRIPTASGSSSESNASRRARSFSHARTTAPAPSQSRTGRQSFSMHNHSTQPPARVVSSTPGPSRSASVSRTWPSPPPRARTVKPVVRPWEPRVLISSNDQSVKMFSLRADTSTPAPARGWFDRTPESVPDRLPSVNTVQGPLLSVTAADDSERIPPAWRDRPDRASSVLPPPPPLMGSRFGWDSLGINQGLLEAHRAEQTAARQRETWERNRRRFEAMVGMAVSVNPVDPQTSGAISHRNILRPGMQAPTSGVRATARDMREERKLAKVGGINFKSPVNHSSLSPDFKTMVSVGDSTEVSIVEVIDGGREFRKIALYHAATDACFSSAWSSDGRKFAVASQDGQVTVWDHRSSRPLSTLFTSLSPSGTSSTSSSPRSPSFSADISAARRYLGAADGWTQVESRALLIDPITGEPSSGASTSGREAARVVKFSPEGSSRELLVFSEENTNIHVVDAKTFNTHVVLPVPLLADVPGSTPPVSTHRTGVEGGECGIAGVAFDPTGEWLYSGTERSVVEWDLRRYGGGEAGSWRMA